MPRDSERPPLVCRWLIRLGTWIAPRGIREDWARKWNTAVFNWWMFLKERGEITPEASTRLVRYCWAAVGDALDARFGRKHTLALVRKAIRGPLAVPAAVLIFLVALGLLTGGFTGVRSAWAGLPYRNPNEIVSITVRDLLGQPHGVASRGVRIWREKSTSFSGLAGFSIETIALDGRETVVARVSAEFFSILGIDAARGRTFTRADERAAEAPIVLTHALWKERFGGSDGAIGRKVRFGDRGAAIAGVLPRSAWALEPRIEAFAPLCLDMDAPLPPPWLVGAIGRLKPGVTREQATAELGDIAREARVRLLGRDPELSDARHKFLGSPLFYANGIFLGAVLGIVLVRAGRQALHRGPGGDSWRFLGFLVLKSVLLATAMTAAWIELTYSVQRNLSGGLRDFMSAMLLGWAYFIACGVAIFWSLRDQHRRCPVCLYRLSLPVTIGSWASALFEPVGTEFLCERGHGSLYTPETQSSASEPERWMELDESWRELFAKESDPGK